MAVSRGVNRAITKSATARITRVEDYVGFYTRLRIIAFNLLAAAGVMWYGIASIGELQTDVANLIESDLKWLGFIAGLYCLNFYIAWRYKDAWVVSSTRMLVFAVIAYLGISHLVDLVGRNWGIISDILKVWTEPTSASERLVVGLRARISTAAVIVSMSLTCIAVGFESKNRGENSG